MISRVRAALFLGVTALLVVPTLVAADPAKPAKKSAATTETRTATKSAATAAKPAKKSAVEARSAKERAAPDATPAKKRAAAEVRPANKRAAAEPRTARSTASGTASKKPRAPRASRATESKPRARTSSKSPARAEAKASSQETRTKGKPSEERATSRRAAVEAAAPKPERVRQASLPILANAIRCPPEMVAVAGRVCVDRHESSLVDAFTLEPLSPHYPPQGSLAMALFEEWSQKRLGARDGTLARRIELPPPRPAAGLLALEGVAGSFEPAPRAVSVAGVLPSGYLSGRVAAQACSAAGKRLCTGAEWVTACRGERLTDFPYGSRYAQGACNVFREAHPAELLHGSASHHHADPRLNLVTAPGGAPLLRATGETPSCASRWGNDAVYDMVGNLDEWIADPGGAFAGGFFSRATRSGCDARVSSHAFDYFDYSTGARCCKDPEGSTSG